MNYPVVTLKAGDRFRSAVPFGPEEARGPGRGGPIPGEHLEGTVVAVGADFVRFDDLRGWALGPGERPEFWAEGGRMCGTVEPKA